MFGADTFCTRIGNQDRPRATRTGIVAKDEPRQEENLGPGNLFLLTGVGHIEVRQRYIISGMSNAMQRALLSSWVFLNGSVPT
jgi:hypothetical protein